MKDISLEMTRIMVEEKCSPFLAFLKVKGSEEDGIRLHQPKSGRELNRRLCNSGNKSSHR